MNSRPDRDFGRILQRLPATSGLFRCLLSLFFFGSLLAQSDSRQVEALVEQPLISPEVVVYQLDQFLIKRVPKIEIPGNGEDWMAAQERIRGRLLEEVVFNGWPEDWVRGPSPVMETGEVLESPLGYRIRKMRYEIVPGLFGAALLYEPAAPLGPAILNVNGHGWDKTAEWKQKRCINQALQGILALNLEWFFYGELSHPENYHWFAHHLDFVGVNGLGIFYLNMRKGLDFLLERSGVDRSRVGMTGLSGGGWQTIVLSALDSRVRAAVPVAGYSSLFSRLERSGPGDIGDIEQMATDLLKNAEYTHFTAMLAPRSALLIHNAKDIFRSHLVKPLIYDQLIPFWRLFGAEENFKFHENMDPADHNYALDNRMQAYRFFAESFGLPKVDEEINVGAELKTPGELEVGLPEDNLTLLGLARKLADGLQREPIPAVGAARANWAARKRRKLQEVVRYREMQVERAWTVDGTRQEGLESRSFRFDFAEGPGATAVWLHAMEGRRIGPATIVLHDGGKKAASSLISERVNRGEQVLALDLFLTGDVILSESRPERHVQVLAALGERPLGIRVSQLMAVAEWLRDQQEVDTIRLEVSGIRSQVVALIAVALFPETFSGIDVHDGISSLRYILDKPVTHAEAPELFCFGLFKEFDLEELEAMQTP